MAVRIWRSTAINAWQGGGNPFDGVSGEKFTPTPYTLKVSDHPEGFTHVALGSDGFMRPKKPPPPGAAGSSASSVGGKAVATTAASKPTANGGVAPSPGRVPTEKLSGSDGDLTTTTSEIAASPVPALPVTQPLLSPPAIDATRQERTSAPTTPVLPAAGASPGIPPPQQAQQQQSPLPQPPQQSQRSQPPQQSQRSQPPQQSQRSQPQLSQRQASKSVASTVTTKRLERARERSPSNAAADASKPARRPAPSR